MYGLQGGVVSSMHICAHNVMDAHGSSGLFTKGLIAV